MIRNYGSRLKKRIREFLEEDDLERAQSLLETHRSDNDVPVRIIEDCEQLILKYEQEKVQNECLENICEAFGKYDFDSAESIFHNSKEFISQAEYERMKEDAVKAKQEKMQNECLENIQKAFKKHNFNSAESIFQDGKEFISQAEYQRMKEDAVKTIPDAIWKAAIDGDASLIDKLRKTSVYSQEWETLYQQYAEIFQCLDNYDFEKADKLVEDLNCHDGFAVKKPKYTKRKVEQIDKYFKKCHEIPIDEEKAKALACNAKSILLKARAGSGKTRTIACKATMLCEKYGISPNRMFVLAFNNAAAEEIQTRIKESIPNFHNGKTFHSFAKSLLDLPKGVDILKGSDLGKFVKKECFYDLWENDPAFSKALYKMFHEEVDELLRPDAFSDENEKKYMRVRNKSELTLKGETVKSKAEKFIADFFFEHAINYEYEKIYFWKNGQKSRPDFTIPLEGNRKIILEHWGIDEHDPLKKIAEGWDVTWDEYHQQMQDKRDYWKNEGVTLLETSICDLSGRRLEFEEHLKKLFESNGVKCIALTVEEKLRKFKEKQENKLIKLFVQFVGRAQKKTYDRESLKQHLYEYGSKNNISEREKIFLRCAYRVFNRYIDAKNESDRIDFDDVMMRATKRILETQGCCKIKSNVRVKDIEAILIDEYQDFSKLFSDMVNACLTYNPDIKVFCVGDDWQAINGFAGSDLSYFELKNFQKHFEDADECFLRTNYRSSGKIITESNKLMSGDGDSSTNEQARPRGDAKAGSVEKIYADKIWIESRKGSKYEKRRLEDARFRSEGCDDGLLLARYKKACYEIICDNPGKSIAIMSRTNDILFKELKGKFCESLIKCFPEDQKNWLESDIHGSKGEKNLKVDSIHQFKGLERDIAIIIGVCRDMFPFIHPDISLFGFFGDTEKTVLDAERRLFYVALTRAKEKLYILTEFGEESYWLADIDTDVKSYNSYLHNGDTSEDDDVPF